MTVEIFKTNIQSSENAIIITGLMHLCFPWLKANVDLQDHDKVLRVESSESNIDPNLLIGFVQNLGFQINVIN